MKRLVGGMAVSAEGPPVLHEGPELHCARCGYSLRYADVDGVCPECGLEVRASVSFATSPECIRARRRVGLAGLLVCLSYGLFALWPYFIMRLRDWLLDGGPLPEPQFSFFIILNALCQLPAMGTLWAALWLCRPRGLECVLSGREGMWRLMALAGLVSLAGGVVVTFLGIYVYWGQMANRPALLWAMPGDVTFACFLIVALWVRRVAGLYPMRRVRGWLTAGILTYVLCFVVYRVPPFFSPTPWMAGTRFVRIIELLVLLGHLALFFSVMVGAVVLLRRGSGTRVGGGAVSGG